MKFALTFISILLINYTQAQIISHFTWDSNPVTTAAFGPNASSSSASATSSINGTGGTNGLNAGLPKADINMVLTGSPTFDVPGIDISFDYQREESQCDWFKRGSSLILDGSDQFAVSYRVSDGMGGYTTVNSGNVYTIPNDDIFRNYRFIYLNLTGEGFLMVNGVVVWSNNGPDNRPLYWTGAGNIQIGFECDGSGSNKTFMDNLIIGSVTNSGLPIELSKFTASVSARSTTLLNWTTKSESDNAYFTVERSADGFAWTELVQIEGAGNSSQTVHYNFEDENPLSGISYYRLKQTDFNGDFTYSDVVSVSIYSGEIELPYPNPTTGLVSVNLSGITASNIRLYKLTGEEIPIEVNETDGIGRIDLSDLPPGAYFIQILTTEPVLHRIIKE